MSIYNMIVNKIKVQKVPTSKDGNKKTNMFFKDIQKHFPNSKSKNTKKYEMLEIPISFRNNVNGTLSKLIIF